MNEEQGITPQKPMGHQQPCKTKPDFVGGERGWEQKEKRKRMMEAEEEQEGKF